MAQLKKCVDFTSSKMEVKWGNRLTLFCRVQPLQSRPALCDPMNCSSPGSCVRGILQARILERIAISSFKGSSWPRGHTHFSYASCIGRQVLYHLGHLEKLFKKNKHWINKEKNDCDLFDLRTLTFHTGMKTLHMEFVSMQI